MCHLWGLPAWWWLGRRYVGLPARLVTPPSALLADDRRPQLRVVLSGTRLGGSDNRFGSRSYPERCVVQVWTNLPYQPHQQSGCFLDPTVDRRWHCLHHPLDDLKLLHQGLSDLFR